MMNWKPTFPNALRKRLTHLLLLTAIVPANLTVLAPSPAVVTQSSMAASNIVPISSLSSNHGAGAPAPEVAFGVGQNGIAAHAIAEAVQNPVAASPRGSSPVSDIGQAYMRTVELGNGERMAMLAAQPLNYLAADGEWRPIDPHFTPQVDGFANLTNLLQIRTGVRRPSVQVQLGDLSAAWMPQRLVLIDETGETAVAAPLPPGSSSAGVLSNQNRTVTYKNSWTQSGIDDEIVAGPGEVEHNVIFAHAPQLKEAGKQDKLVMRALLSLPPGAQVVADGQVQTGAFTTTGTVELRDFAGSVRLRLPAARISERARPDQGFDAIYSFEPQDSRSWLVSMETPASWWTDPARQYPVIWDPIMQTLRALSVAQIYDNPACAAYLLSDPGLAGVGRAPCYNFFAKLGESRVRTLVRFDNITQLNLPLGAELQSAILLAAPSSAYVNYVGSSPWTTVLNTELHRVTGACGPELRQLGQPAVGRSERLPIQQHFLRRSYRSAALFRPGGERILWLFRNQVVAAKRPCRRGQRLAGRRQQQWTGTARRPGAGRQLWRPGVLQFCPDPQTGHLE